MYSFTLERPVTLANAAQLAAEGGSPLAGGQTLLASMKLRLSAPGQLVDLSRISGLASITGTAGEISIGAMARHAAVAESVVVRERFPALAELASRIGDRQVRTMGTIGGSVANNDPAACYPSALLACGATVVTNQREIAADDFFLGLFTTALAPGELITGLRFPLPQRAAYEKLRQQASHFPLIGVFVAKYATGVRVAVTGGGNGVVRHKALEAALTTSFTPEAIAQVQIDPAGFMGDLHASPAYRASLVNTLCRRAVERA